MLSSLLFALVMDAITKNTIWDVINEILCADDLVLVSETMKDLKSFESEGSIRT